MNTIITIVGHGIVASITVDRAHDTPTFRECAHDALGAIRRRGLAHCREEVDEWIIGTEWESGYVRTIVTASLRSAKA